MVQSANSIEMLARQNCASILLACEAAKSTALEKPLTAAVSGGARNYLLPTDQMFRCKDCDRRFATFQALGGHRASHVKLRLTNQEAAETIAAQGGFAAAPRPARFKIHECRECRVRFPTGQALGGHMRKHAELSAKRKRAELENLLEAPKKICNETFQVLDESKKSGRVVLDLDLDLNSPPPEDESLLKLA